MIQLIRHTGNGVSGQSGFRGIHWQVKPLQKLEPDAGHKINRGKDPEKWNILEPEPSIIVGEGDTIVLAAKENVMLELQSIFGEEVLIKN